MTPFGQGGAREVPVGVLIRVLIEVQVEVQVEVMGA